MIIRGLQPETGQIMEVDGENYSLNENPQSPKGGLIPPNQCCLIPPNRPLQKAQEMLRFAENRDVFLKKLEQRNPQKVSAMASAIHSGQWTSDIFRDPDAYTILLQLYNDESIHQLAFEDAQQYLSILTQFSGRHDLMPDQRLEGTVTRFDLADQNNEADYEKMMLWTKWQRIAPDLRIKCSTWIKEIVRDFHDRQMPCWCTEVKLSQENITSIERLMSGFETIDSRRCLTNQLLLWTINLATQQSPVCAAPENFSSLYFLSPAILAFMAFKQSQEPISVKLFYGTQKANDLSELRQKNCHPVAIYHPDISNPFFFPHDVFSGALFSQQHDYSHEILLNKAPLAQRNMYLRFNCYEQSLIAGINNPENSQHQHLNFFKGYFKYLEEKVKCGSNSVECLLLNRRNLLNTFDENQPLLDQDFSIEELESSSHNEKAFFRDLKIFLETKPHDSLNALTNAKVFYFLEQLLNKDRQQFMVLSGWLEKANADNSHDSLYYRVSRPSFPPFLQDINNMCEYLLSLREDCDEGLGKRKYSAIEQSPLETDRE